MLHQICTLNRRILLTFLCCIYLFFVSSVSGQNAQQTDLELNSDRAVDNKHLPTGRAIDPEGDLITFHGRPVDLQISRDSKWLFVKDRDQLRIIDTATWKLTQSISSPDGASLWGLAVDKLNRVYFTNSKSAIHVYAPSDQADAVENPYQLLRTIQLPADSFPCGIKISDDQFTAYVCLSKKNSLAIVDLTEDKVTQTIDVGVAPFDVVQESKEFLFVSNLGGMLPAEGDNAQLRENRGADADEPADASAPADDQDRSTAPSAGTETSVDNRGIANQGSVAVVNLETGDVTRHVKTGLHPSVMIPGINPGLGVVCETNNDTIGFFSLVDEKTQSFSVKPLEELPFGSMPSAIHATGNQYLVALAGNNAVAVVDLGADYLEPKLIGLIPTAWYPVAIETDEKFVYVACVKGVGARFEKRGVEEGMNSHDHLGAIQRFPKSVLTDADQLKVLTAKVYDLSRIQQIVKNSAPVANAESDSSSSLSVTPRPVPQMLGQPSVFKHIIYVIKENRTFDQVFGDLDEVGVRAQPELCVFPEKITPNHHALARRFGILDNYYCNGVLSADGHSWATEGNVTPYLERAFGGFARSYTFGDDPLTYSSSGFLWDHFLAAGLSFRNYGEMDYAEPPAGMKYQEIWKAYSAGEKIEFAQKIGVERIRGYSCRDYPGWNMLIPDVLRMDRFLKEFREFEKNGALPNLTLIYLPQDHLGGGVTSEAHMADNDLAVGRLVEAVSKSDYWKDTVIFINEDDPQNGYDHIDGHRSLCLVVSPYSKPGVNHSFYNQTSVLRTMLHLFGLPPMNQQDASMPLMANCFQEQSNLKPYLAIDANVPLNQTAKPKAKQSALERKWRTILATVPIERTGMKTEEDESNLNRFVWHEIRGWETPYPDEWSGAHGKGLEILKLKLDGSIQDD